MGLKFYHNGIINIINNELPLLLKGNMKEKGEGIFVRYLIVKFTDADSLQRPLTPLCDPLFLCAFCEKYFCKKIHFSVKQNSDIGVDCQCSHAKVCVKRIQPSGAGVAFRTRSLG